MCICNMQTCQPKIKKKEISVIWSRRLGRHKQSLGDHSKNKKNTKQF